MGIFSRFLPAGRVRELSRALAADPCADAYAELAQEQALRGDARAAAETAREGLAVHKGDARLQRLHERAASLLREERMRELAAQLRSAPRAALRSEMCALLLEAGRLERAEEAALEWAQADGGAEPLLAQAAARARRYFGDRRRDDARAALELCAKVERQEPQDARPLRLRMEICSRVGAWSDALHACSRLLELCPGDAPLEARHRTLAALAPSSHELESALREVERSGRFADEDYRRGPDAGQPAGLRPLLVACVRPGNGIASACALRGATALVQGERGASAERSARGVRDSVAAARTMARKLGLGTLRDAEFELEGATLLLAAGENGSAALRVQGTANEAQRELLRELAAAADGAGGDA